jgi:hypothetical protein
LNGHHHLDATTEVGGIILVHGKSASNYGMGARKAESYGADIRASHPSLASVALCCDPLWLLGRVAASAGTLVLREWESAWVKPTPWQRGATEPKMPRDRVRPRTGERTLSV